MELLIYITAFILGYIVGKQTRDPSYITDIAKAAKRKLKRTFKKNEASVSDFETVAEKEYREQPLAIREEIDRITNLGGGCTMKLRPMPGHILVEPHKDIATKSGIFLPGEAGETRHRGVVIAVGYNGNSKLIGQDVIFKAYDSDEIEDTLTQERFLIMAESNILAIVIDD